MSIKNDQGITMERPTDIKEEAEKYFRNLFVPARSMEFQESEIQNIHLSRFLSQEQKDLLIQPITEQEIKSIVFDMDGSKAPGPDGFNATFFKDCWNCVGNEVTKAIRWFFCNPFMPRDVNSTFLCLIPKMDCPTSFADFRPIALCNVIYKIIAKLLANRLQICISSLVAGNQSAFIKGRSIADNILLCHDIVRGIDRTSSPPIAVMKVDLQKAYDSVDRRYLMLIMAKMGFPSQYLQWISACIHTPMFSVLINGSPAGYFKGDRGIRQGDPLSPYLFTLCMEPLSVMLEDAVRNRQVALPHRCKSLALSHLMFADDLMLFSKANCQAIKSMLNIMQTFSNLSGLRINYSKSSIILGGIEAGERNQIINASGFQRGSLPISYLGIPLVQASISAKDCDPIILKIRKKIEGWKCRFLSYAGRLQLIASVLQSSYIYWAGLFGLPKKTCTTIESMLSKFLWSGPELKRKVQFVSWAKICLPKSEGGLGIRRVKDNCSAGIMKQLWSIITNKNTLWVQWIRRKYLKKDSIWTANNSKNFSWSWRNLLRHRDMMIRKTTYSVESGEDTYFWLDPWRGEDPLWTRIGNATSFINDETKMASVKDYREGSHWKSCPNTEIPIFRSIWTDLNQIDWRLSDRADKIRWMSTSGVTKDLSTKEAWESCRSRGHKVNWAKAIWFSTNIPKHSFVAWRACLGALPTADQLQMRNITIDNYCRLCDKGIDTHQHLFFECDFSTFVWGQCMGRCIPRIGRTATCDIEAARIEGIKGKGSHISCIPKIMFNAIVYNLWKERNIRSFENKRKTKEEVCRNIIRGIEDKISSLSFQRAKNPLEDFLCTKWNIDVH